MAIKLLGPPQKAQGVVKDRKPRGCQRATTQLQLYTVLPVPQSVRDGTQSERHLSKKSLMHLLKKKKFHYIFFHFLSFLNLENVD